MTCIDCNGLGGHRIEITLEGRRLKRLKPCLACSGTGEVSSSTHRSQIAELTADDKNDERKLRDYEKASK